MTTLQDEELANRLTSEALRILGAIGVRWNISDSDVARLAKTTTMGYLRRLNGYDDEPFDQMTIHRVTALGLIDRSLSNGNIDPAAWVSGALQESPFNGRNPLDVLPEMGLEDLTALNIHLGAVAHRPTEISIPFR